MNRTCLAVLLFFAWLPASAQSRATPPRCPDLSGRYLIPTEDGAVIVIVAQTRCESAKIEWNIIYNDTTYSRHNLKLDGQFHPDNGWFGDPGGLLISASFRGDTLQLVARAKPGNPPPQSFITASFRSITGGICTRFTRQGGGEGTWTFAWRNRPGRTLTEDEKADGDFRCNRSRRSDEMTFR